MKTSLFTALEAEWSKLGASTPALAAVEIWARSDLPLRSFRNLHGIVHFVQHTGVGSRSDQVLACLAKRAPTDPFAARTLLHVVFYGLRRITADLASAASSDEEAESEVVAEAYGRIRSYPVDRRPRSIAANILLDTRQGVSRTLCRRRVPELLTADIGRHAERAAKTCAADELLSLVDEAVRTRKLRIDDARLIVLSRVAGVSTAELAAIRGCEPQSLRRSRQRAEARLAAAVRCVRVTRSSGRSSILACDEFVAVAPPASRGCQSSSATPVSTRPLRDPQSSASDRTGRCSTRHGRWPGVQSRTSGSTRPLPAVSFERSGREIPGRKGRSPRSTCKWATHSRSRCAAGQCGRLDTRASRTLTTRALCSCRRPPSWTRSPWLAKRSTSGKSRNSPRSRTRGAIGLKPRGASTATRADLVWSRSR